MSKVGCLPNFSMKCPLGLSTGEIPHVPGVRAKQVGTGGLCKENVQVVLCRAGRGDVDGSERCVCAGVCARSQVTYLQWKNAFVGTKPLSPLGYVPPVQAADLPGLSAWD